LLICQFTTLSWNIAPVTPAIGVTQIEPDGTVVTQDPTEFPEDFNDPLNKLFRGVLHPQLPGDPIVS